MFKMKALKMRFVLHLNTTNTLLSYSQTSMLMSTLT